MIFKERVHLDRLVLHIFARAGDLVRAPFKNFEKNPASDRRHNQRLCILRLAHQIAGMTHIDDRRLDRRFERLEKQLPARAARTLRWLRDPSSTWIRIPTGILLIIGGLFSFLPILGIWMLPLGLLLLAQDVPFLKRPTSRAMIWLERRWIEWRRRRALKSAAR
jgi:hypothetical protein